MSNSLFQMTAKCQVCGKEYVVAYSQVICPECQKAKPQRDSFKDSHSPAVKTIDIDNLLDSFPFAREQASIAAHNRELGRKNFEEKWKHEGWTRVETDNGDYRYKTIT